MDERLELELRHRLIATGIFVAVPVSVSLGAAIGAAIAGSGSIDDVLSPTGFAALMMVLACIGFVPAQCAMGELRISVPRYYWVAGGMGGGTAVTTVIIATTCLEVDWGVVFIPILAGAAAPVLVSCVLQPHEDEGPPTHCVSCGCDLRASMDRCPECGTPIVPSQSERT